MQCVIWFQQRLDAVSCFVVYQLALVQSVCVFARQGCCVAASLEQHLVSFCTAKPSLQAAQVMTVVEPACESSDCFGSRLKPHIV